MKIPYIKLYTSDVLAKSRKLNNEQIGRLVLSACEIAFEGSTENAPQNEAESAFFDMLNEWMNEAKTALKQKKNAGKKGGLATQKKYKVSDGSTACFSASSTSLKHTDTDTDTETNTKTETDNKTTNSKQPFAVLKNQKEQKPNRVYDFGSWVAKVFDYPMDENQFNIWFKRNCRTLKSILDFSGDNMQKGFLMIQACLDKLNENNLTFSYESVIRRAPEYFAQAEKWYEEGFRMRQTNDGFKRLKENIQNSTSEKLNLCLPEMEGKL